MLVPSLTKLIYTEIETLSISGALDTQKYQAAKNLRSHFKNAALGSPEIRDIANAFIQVGMNEAWNIHRESIGGLFAYFPHQNTNDTTRQNILEALLGPRGIALQKANENDLVRPTAPTLRADIASGLETLIRGKNSALLSSMQLQSICDAFNQPGIGINDPDLGVKKTAGTVYKRAQTLISKPQP